MQAAVEGIYSALVESVALVVRNILVVEDRMVRNPARGQKHLEVDRSLYRIDLAEAEGRNHHIDREEGNFAVEDGMGTRHDSEEDPAMGLAEDLVGDLDYAAEVVQVGRNSRSKSAFATTNNFV